MYVPNEAVDYSVFAKGLVSETKGNVEFKCWDESTKTWRSLYTHDDILEEKSNFFRTRINSFNIGQTDEVVFESDFSENNEFRTRVAKHSDLVANGWCPRRQVKLQKQ